MTTGLPRREARLTGAPPPTGASEKAGAARPTSGERMEWGSGPRVIPRLAERGTRRARPAPSARREGEGRCGPPDERRADGMRIAAEVHHQDREKRNDDGQARPQDPR